MMPRGNMPHPHIFARFQPGTRKNSAHAQKIQRDVIIAAHDYSHGDLQHGKNGAMRETGA